MDRIGKDSLFRAAKTASLVAALALVAQSEWALALAVGWPAWIAWAAPVALDAYVLAAVTAHRDLGPSVVVSSASVFGSHAVYAAPAAWEGGTAGQGHLIWWMAAGCSVVPLLVTWRVHHLTLSTEDIQASPVKLELPAPAFKEAAPVVEPAPAPVPVVAAPRRAVTVPDAELADIIAAALKANPAAGFPTIATAIKDAGWLVGNTERVKAALRDHKNPGLRVVAGG